MINRSRAGLTFPLLLWCIFNVYQNLSLFPDYGVACCITSKYLARSKN